MNNKILFNSPDFDEPIPELEQYSTPPDIAFEIIKKVNSSGNLSGKVVDLGSGTGRLAIAAALLAADFLAGAFFVATFLDAVFLVGCLAI